MGIFFTCRGLHSWCIWGFAMKVETCGDFLSSPSSDGVSVVPVTARGAVGVQPVLHVGLLGPLIQSLHVKHVLLHGGVMRSNKWRWKIHLKKKKKKQHRKADKCMACCQHLHKWIWMCEGFHWARGVTQSCFILCFKWLCYTTISTTISIWQLKAKLQIWVDLNNRGKHI